MFRPSIPLICLASIFTHSAIAEDYSVTQKAFKKVTNLSGTFLPSNFTEISVAPKIWTTFTVTSYVSQAAVVKKGDVLIGIDTKKLDEHIAKEEKNRETDLLNLAKAKHELAQLEISTPRSLEKYARAEKEALENLKWFTDIGRPHDIENTNNSVERAELSLSYQIEELKQLEKMYAEDNVTEETEEIILIRTRNAVKRNEFALKAAKLSAARALETTIPRSLENYKRTAKSATIDNASAQTSLKRTLETKRLTVAKAIKADAEKAEKLAKVKADRAMMNITAPADGIIYYGSMKDGKWNPLTASKILKVGGKIPANMAVMTFIPTSSKLNLSAFATENQLAGLKKGGKGRASSTLQPYSSFPVTVSQVSTHPGADTKYSVAITQDGSNQQNIVAGMKASIRIISDQKENAILVPVSYLTPADNGGYTVKLKMADGETATRAVEVSVANKEHAVISKGLEVGQVIIK